MIPSLRRLGRRAVFQHDNEHCLAKEAEGRGDGLAKHVSRSKPNWASVGHPQKVRSLTSTSSVISSWRSGRGLQWQPVKLWWSPCPRRLRQCWKIMVATQNIDTLGPIWTFSLRGVLTFLASGLDINCCVFSYFEGTANLHCYTSWTFTNLNCSKVSFLQCCHMKRKYLQKCEGCTHFCEILQECELYTYFLKLEFSFANMEPAQTQEEGFITLTNPSRS